MRCKWINFAPDLATIPLFNSNSRSNIFFNSEVISNPYAYIVIFFVITIPIPILNLYSEFFLIIYAIMRRPIPL